MNPRLRGLVRMGCLCVALYVAAVPARAQGAADTALQACVLCHGIDGHGTGPDIPHLAGQRRAYLAAQLQAFRAGRRTHDEMGPVAARLGDADIERLATHWASRAPPASPASAPVLASHVRFPAGFPAGYREYARRVDGDTVAIVYANDVAWAAARAGHALPDGSAIVTANHAAQAASAPGALQSLAVMASGAGWGDEVPALLRNGNWHYGLFRADGTPVLRGLHPRCLACHLPQAARSHVFSVDELKAAAAR
ncbi:MAG: cytochrome P460 family protein [Rubrivivax sp.]